jgi:hypothetical protein
MRGIGDFILVGNIRGKAMPDTYCLLNHPLTENQLKELRDDFHAGTVIYPDEDTSQRWSQIPVNAVLAKADLAPFVTWLLSAREGDILILQGEFGSVFALADYALSRGLIPIHAVARRVARETRNGETVQKTYIFEHVCFRRYQYFKDLYAA